MSSQPLLPALPDWPYPRWIAHRGAGKLAPENTLAAFRAGARARYRMFECDVKLSADGVAFLLHDDTLQRTTNAATVLPPGASLQAGSLPWHTLSQLDAGTWHSPQFAGETLPTLDAIAAFCLAHQCLLNIEIKPSPGTARHTGEVVARQAAHLWREAAVPPLLSSFEVAALEGAQAAAPELPRALLLDAMTPDWLDTAQRLGCKAVVCNYRLWNAQRVGLARQAGMRTLSYTVNDAAVADELLALGTDGLITDRIDQFKPD
jgi:glycerophosphoryl diester phosphodiesterase